MRRGEGGFFSDLLLYAQCYLLTIATILGTGVLGAPGALAKCGLTPFLPTIAISAFIQVMSIYYMVDALQKCVAILLDRPRSSQQGRQSADGDDARIPLTALTDDEDNSDGKTDIEDVRSPDLHMVGEMFLPRVGAVLFDGNVMLYLFIFVISYGLAGSTALAELLHLRLTLAMILFCWILNVLAVFGRRVIMPLVSVLTLFKATVLIITIFVAFVVGYQIQIETHTDFAYIGQPIVISTIALGGAPLTLPYMFGKLRFEAKQIRYFRMAVSLGIVTCMLLNIFWAWSVLEVVPQYNICEQGGDNSSVTECSTHFNYTLLDAEEHGEISAIPFKKVINESYPQYNWVAILVTMFILASITVSYLVFTTTIAHTVDGVVYSLWPKDKWRCLDCLGHISTLSMVGCLVSITIMTIVFIIVHNNPQGFVVILQDAGGPVVNIFCGVFICWINWCATRDKYSHLDVPVPLSKIHIYLMYPVAFCFNFAVVYNIVELAMQLSGKSLY